MSKTSHGLRPSKEDRAPEGASADDTEELDEESGNVLMSLISQLRIGMDLSKVTLPTFVLEPRSMLERITDFLSHPELIFGADQLANPEDRFLAVLAYYMSGWHIKPKGVKKPYNPVLGEFYRCSYTYPNGTTAHYIAEQVSHHPPISAYYYISPENNLLIYGDLRPKSKFLGNSAATLMGGESCVALLGQPGDGEYRISMPNMYARGIMFGKMVLELGDTSRVTNRANDIQSDVEFKVKGYFTGSYNSVGAKVQHNGKSIGELSGRWSDTLEYKDTRTGATRVFVDARQGRVAQRHDVPLQEQEPMESQRLWAQVTEGIKSKNMDMATEAKTVIEDAQRQATRQREAQGVQYQPRFFTLKNDRYVPNMAALPPQYCPPNAVQHFSQPQQA